MRLHDRLHDWQTEASAEARILRHFWSCVAAECAGQDIRVHALAIVRQPDHGTSAEPCKRQTQNAVRRGKFDCVGQQRQQCPAHLSAVNPDENRRLRQINLQRSACLPAQIICVLRQFLQKINQISLFQRQRQPTALDKTQISQIFRCAQQLVAGAVEHGQVLLHRRVLGLGKKREKRFRYGQQRCQRCGD